MSTLFDDLPFPRPTSSTEAARDAEVDAAYQQVFRDLVTVTARDYFAVLRSRRD